MTRLKTRLPFCWSRALVLAIGTKIYYYINYCNFIASTTFLLIESSTLQRMRSTKLQLSRLWQGYVRDIYSTNAELFAQTLLLIYHWYLLRPKSEALNHDASSGKCSDLTQSYKI